MHKQENLSFDIIVFVNDSSVINKISLFDLTMSSQSAREEVGMFVCFEQSLYEKKPELIILLTIAYVWGKAP